MIRKMRCVAVMVLIVGMLVDSSFANAASTQGGSLGKTTVECSISINGNSSSYNQAYLKISTAHRVEKLGIKNINIIKKDGGGTTGGSTSNTNAYSAAYAGAAYAPGSIKNISAKFYVTSNNFGNFTKNMSY